MTTRRLRAFALTGLITLVAAATAIAAPGGTSTGPVQFTLGSDEAVDWDSSGARQNADGVGRGSR